MIDKYKKCFIFINNRKTLVALELLALASVLSTMSWFLWMPNQDSVIRKEGFTNHHQNNEYYTSVQLSNSKDGLVTGEFVLKLNNQTLLNAVQEKEHELRRLSSGKMGSKKLILLWTKFFFVSGAEAFCVGKNGTRKQKEICDYECEFTTDRNTINSSHAVVFNERDLITDRTRKHPLGMPKNKRPKSQYWIFLNLESPFHTFTNLAAYENIFNWTMTYRSDSHVPISYGLVQEHREKITDSNYTKFVLQNIQKKTKLVAWISSNSYYQPSKRTELVAELRKYIDIDVYGKSGTFNCSNASPIMCQDLLSCYTQIGTHYKFYLAFENSLCEDYVTEKAFNALRTGMVPIVYGYANYTKFLPTNSFINVRDFSSAKELANYLIHLNENEEDYLKYFEWTLSHMVVEDTFYLERAWCSLCKRLHLDSTPHTVEDLKSWWDFRNNSKVCVSPPPDFGSKLF